MLSRADGSEGCSTFVRIDETRGGGSAGMHDDTSMHDDTNDLLSYWAEAKRAKDFVKSDALREQLRARGVEPERSAAAPKTRLKLDDRSTVDGPVLEYITAAGYQSALPLTYVKASDVLAAARAATGITDACDSFILASLLRLLEQATSCKVVRTKASHANPWTGIADVYWGVTCSSLPAAPLATPECYECKDNKEEKKAQRAAWLRARGKPEPDPLRSRIVGKNADAHYSMYTNELLSLTCAPKLLELKLFPSAKELTESFSCFAAVRAHLSNEFRPDDPSVLLVCVGDGLTPRTAGLFCFRTKWKCISVDPLMRGPLGFHSDETRWSEHIERLTARRARLQDAAPEPAGKFVGERVLLVLPHAHIGLDECLQCVRGSAQLGAVLIAI
jgi:hypothetical protein